MSDCVVEVVELRGNGGLGVFLRAGDDQRLFRVAPVRDPNQPRFWCLAVFACSACGIPESGTAIWAGAWGSSQGDLTGLLDEIKADATAWVTAEHRGALRAKLMQPRPPQPLPVARTPRADRAAVAEVAVNATERAS